MVNSMKKRSDASPAMQGLDRPEQEGQMRDKEKLRKHIDKLLADANERELRLVLIATQGILRK